MSDLQELFARDPLKLTQQDLMKIIEYERSRRMSFNLTGKAPTKATKAAKPSKVSKEVADQVDLTDLL